LTSNSTQQHTKLSHNYLLPDVIHSPKAYYIYNFGTLLAKNGC